MNLDFTFVAGISVYTKHIDHTMLKLGELEIIVSKDALKVVPEGKVLINTINAHSYNVAQNDELFAEALRTDDKSQLASDNECVKYLIPDGASIVKACKFLDAKSQPVERIAGWDLFLFEMEKLNGCMESWNNGTLENRKKVMFMGSSEKVLTLIKENAAKDYPSLEVVTYSPPYKPEFSDEDNVAIIKAINDADPDLLWIGMTAPKQEKWTYSHWKELNIHCHVGTIGAVFDFYAGTAVRAPQWWQEHSLEWLYRLVKEPKRMWRRYVLGNPLEIN